METNSRTLDAGKWLKLSEAAKQLGVSEITVRRRVKDGRLAFDFRGGKYYVFIPDGIDPSHFLDSSEVKEGDVLHSAGLARATHNDFVPAPANHLESSLDRASAAVNLLRPYVAEAKRTPMPVSLKGPSNEQIIAILKVEVQEKEKEVFVLKKKIADQSVLIGALEAALEELSNQK